MMDDELQPHQSWISLIQGLLILILAPYWHGCDSDHPPPDLPSGDHAIFIVCSGNYQTSNAQLDIIDTFYTDTIHHSVYRRVNGTALGGYAHRMIVVDSLGIITVTEKNQLTVIHTRDYRHHRSLPVRSPRDVVVQKPRLYVSSYMDSAIVIFGYPSFDKETTIRLRHKAGHLACAGGKIFIMNSDTLFTSPKSDTLITVMDAQPPYATRSIAVGFSPIDAAVDPQGQYLYIACKGRSTQTGYIAVMEVNNETVHRRIGADEGIRPVRVCVGDSILAIIASDNGFVRVYHRSREERIQVINNPASLIAFCNGELLIGDARDYISSGEILWFDKNYRLRKRYRTGIYPAHICFNQSGPPQ